MNDFDLLKKMIYPGRFIILGQSPSGEEAVIVYSVTGRSVSSQARNIVAADRGFWVRPTDKEILNKGRPELLVYPAVLFSRGIAVSNGRQTEDIVRSLEKKGSAVEALVSALLNWDYEPDSPNFTPRISGCVLLRGEAALSIIKRGEKGLAVKNYFQFSLSPGRGFLISTYAGENLEPLPSFKGEPLSLAIREKTSEAMASSLYKALAPSRKDQDFRVSCLAIYVGLDDINDFRAYIINRQERKN